MWGPRYLVYTQWLNEQGIEADVTVRGLMTQPLITSACATWRKDLLWLTPISRICVTVVIGLISQWWDSGPMRGSILRTALDI